MRRTVAIVLAIAVVGGLAGASIGLALDNGSSATTSADSPAQHGHGPRPGADLSKQRSRCRRDHRQTDPGRPGDALQPGAEAASHRARLGLRDQFARRHRDQRSRRPGSEGHRDRLQRRGVLPGEDRRHGPLDGHRRRARDRAGSCASPAAVRRLVERSGRRSGLRDRQSFRARANDDRRDHQCHGPRHSGSERPRDPRCAPDGRPDQPRQLRRSAARPLRARDRHQLADRGRHGRRERRRRLCDPDCHRHDRSPTS